MKTSLIFVAISVMTLAGCNGTRLHPVDAEGLAYDGARFPLSEESEAEGRLHVDLYEESGGQSETGDREDLIRIRFEVRNQGEQTTVIDFAKVKLEDENGAEFRHRDIEGSAVDGTQCVVAGGERAVTDLYLEYPGEAEPAEAFLTFVFRHGDVENDIFIPYVRLRRGQPLVYGFDAGGSPFYGHHTYVDHDPDDEPGNPARTPSLSWRTEHREKFQTAYTGPKRPGDSSSDGSDDGDGNGFRIGGSGSSGRSSNRGVSTSFGALGSGRSRGGASSGSRSSMGSRR